MVYKPRRERRRGGKAANDEPLPGEDGLPEEHGNQYNAKGSPEEKSESAKSDGFKRGGRMKKKEGGKVEGHGAKHHLGKRARGGRMEHMEHKKEHEKHEEERPERARGGHVGHKRARGGGAPFSAAHNISPPGNDKGTGPGEKADTIP